MQKTLLDDSHPAMDYVISDKSRDEQLAYILQQSITISG